MKHLYPIIFLLLIPLLSKSEQLTVTSKANIGPGSLRNIIEKAQNGDSIYFDFSTYPQTILLDSGINFTKGFRLFGPGKDKLIIEANGGIGNIFNSNQAGISTLIYIEKISFQTASSVLYGYSMYQDIIVYDCNFINVVHGALHTSDTLMTLKVDQCFFQNCYYGIRALGNLNVTNSTFDSCGQEPINFRRGVAKIAKCVFKNEKENGQGVRGYEATAYIEHCDFIDNNGDPLYIGRGNAFIKNCTFANNKGRGYGGVTVSMGDTVTFTKCSFMKNEGFKGAGIDASEIGFFKVDSCIFSNNVVPTDGGAIYSYDSKLIITNTTFDNNKANTGGGAIRAMYLTIANCTFNNNSCGWFGGAIYAMGKSTIYNSTFSNNSASIGGALVIGSDTTTMNHCTITQNIASDSAGGIYLYQAGGNLCALSLGNSIVAGNTDSTNKANDIDGTLLSKGYNIVGIKTGAKGFVATDTTGTIFQPVDAGLEALADNGGFTMTHALKDGSPAIGRGKRNPQFNYDQRGKLRDALPDIGAFERNDITSIKEVTGLSNVFSVYPNPASDHFYIRNGNVEKSIIEIYSIDGYRVAELRPTDNSYFSIASLTEGMYFVKLKVGENYEGTDKLVIRK